MEKHTRKPDKQRVVESYWYEVKARGKSGAYRRTGDIYRISDQTVIRYVQQATAPQPVLADDLVYVPCPGEKPIAPAPLPQKQPRVRPCCHRNNHKRMLHACGILRQPVRSNVAIQPQTEVPHCHTVRLAQQMCPWPYVPLKTPHPEPHRTWTVQPSVWLTVVLALVVLLLAFWH